MATSLELLISSLFDESKVGSWRLDDGSPNYTAFAWPPDAFAVAATVLRDSGAYLQVARPHDYPADCRFRTSRWTTYIRGIASEWRCRDNEHEGPPAAVREIIDEVVAAAGRCSLSELSRPDRRNLEWFPFVKLMCAADQTCRGVGIHFPIVTSKSQPDVQLAAVAKRLMTYPRDSVICKQCALFLASQLDAIEELEKGDAAETAGFNPLTLCRNVQSELAIVLPKMRTSQRGVTIRSLSLHLALLSGSDVEPIWSSSEYALLENAIRPTAMPVEEAIEPARIAEQAGPYNLVVIPWPEEIRPKQFVPVSGPLACLGDRPQNRDAFFEFRHDDFIVERFREYVKNLISEAEATVGVVHGIVLPEMSMTRRQFDNCFGQGQQVLGVHFVVCGVYEPPGGERELGRNYAIVRRKTSKGLQWIKQEKHHRWALDKSQLETYSLGSTLRSDKVWWEGTNIPRRRLSFFGLDSFNAFTVLICEDLARPDPVGDAVRAIGPNLVLCLLMDGPQLGNRWSARYSTVLSDDPGSSILTVSSMGMVSLSRVRERIHEKSRVICLWREPEKSPVELTLDPDASALLLSLSAEPRTEYTIDGRGEEGMASVLRLAGVYPLRRRYDS